MHAGSLILRESVEHGVHRRVVLSADGTVRYRRRSRYHGWYTYKTAPAWWGRLVYRRHLVALRHS